MIKDDNNSPPTMNKADFFFALNEESMQRSVSVFSGSVSKSVSKESNRSASQSQNVTPIDTCGSSVGGHRGKNKHHSRISDTPVGIGDTDTAMQLRLAEQRQRFLMQNQNQNQNDGQGQNSEQDNLQLQQQ